MHNLITKILFKKKLLANSQNFSLQNILTASDKFKKFCHDDLTAKTLLATY